MYFGIICSASMETIQRKTLLYRTGVGGMDHYINHVLGCAHGCRYPCYAFSMAQSYGRVRSYDEWCRPKLVGNALELLDKELPRLKEKIRSVHLCFSAGVKDEGESMQNDFDMLKKELIKRLEDYFGSDEKRIAHAKNVLKYAEQLLRAEKADPYVVIPAAVLHDVGIKAAEEKYGSAAARYQEKEGPAIAGRILVEMGYEDQNVYEICAIIARHHSPRAFEDTNFKVVYDADWLVNFPEEVAVRDPEKIRQTIRKIFLTPSGRETAEKLFLP